MGIIEKIQDFENQSLQAVAFNMVKWFMFDNVTIETTSRMNVESRVWISVTITKEEKTFFLWGQRPDIVHRRLVEFLRSHLEDKNSTAG